MILLTSSVVKITGLDSWMHHTRLKPWKPETVTRSEQLHTSSCEPIEDLRFLFKKKTKTSGKQLPILVIVLLVFFFGPYILNCFFGFVSCRLKAVYLLKMKTPDFCRGPLDWISAEEPLTASQPL